MKKVLIIYGHQRQENTHHVVGLIKEHMLSMGDCEFTEYVMPKDLPFFCRGCFNCIIKREELCPDRKYMEPILKSMIEADGIVLASPVHCLDVSVGMKNFIDHLAYMWMPHRPREEMFDKIGLVVSTAAGAGMKRTNTTMKKALVFMGAKRIHALGFAVQASKYEDIKESIREKIKIKTKKTAEKFNRDLSKRHRMRPTFFRVILMKAMGSMIKGYDHQNPDRQYWVSKGWIKEKS